VVVDVVVVVAVAEKYVVQDILPTILYVFDSITITYMWW